MQTLHKKIEGKSTRIGIVGLGYVGLPLALAFAEASLHVLGFDVQQNKVDSVNQGKSYIADISDDQIAIALTSKHLEATTDQSRLKEVDAIFICVPTPLTKTKNPDLSYVIHEAEIIAKNLKPGQLVVLESTTYPGTTREIVLAILERSGLKVGIDFYLAFSPERVDPGSVKYGIKNTPKLVGGIDPQSTELAKLLYSQAIDTVVSVSCPEVAEMTKIFENVFRSVNIALVNELTMLCEKMGISVWEVIDAASTKPFGYTAFYPGPGIGGHCIPLDPYYLSNKAREYDFHTRFIELAADINEQMPYYVISRIFDMLSVYGKSLSGAKVLILGIAYKKNVGDMRESPSLKIIQILRQKQTNVSYNDPYIDAIQLGDETLKSTELTDECLSSADCVVIATDHSCFDYQNIADKATLVFDTRGVMRKIKSNSIIHL